jgi:hypothetical protein
MEMLVWLLAQILIVLLTVTAGGALACSVSLRKRFHRFKDETEQVLVGLRRDLEGLQSGNSEEAEDEEEKKARAAERLFTEGLNSILGYDFAARESERV